MPTDSVMERLRALCGHKDFDCAIVAAALRVVAGWHNLEIERIKHTVWEGMGDSEKEWAHLAESVRLNNWADALEKGEGDG